MYIYTPSQSAPWLSNLCFNLYIRSTWYIFRVWNFNKYKVTSTLFLFRVFLLAICNLKEKRLGCLFSLWRPDPIFCTPYFGPYFFQGRKPTHVFKTRIVGADWLVGQLDAVIKCLQGSAVEVQGKSLHHEKLYFWYAIYLQCNLFLPWPLLTSLIHDFLRQVPICCMENKRIKKSQKSDCNIYWRNFSALL